MKTLGGLPFEILPILDIPKIAAIAKIAYGDQQNMNEKAMKNT